MNTEQRTREKKRKCRVCGRTNKRLAKRGSWNGDFAVDPDICGDCAEAIAAE